VQHVLHSVEEHFQALAACLDAQSVPAAFAALSFHQRESEGAASAVGKQCMPRVAEDANDRVQAIACGSRPENQSNLTAARNDLDFRLKVVVGPVWIAREEHTSNVSIV
jgi:hypothetical protein